MQIINFKINEDGAIKGLKNNLEKFINKETLVINDTRGMIIPSVLPFIEFVCTYDQRIFSMLSNTNVIFTEPFSGELEDYYKSLGLTEGVNVLLTPNVKEITLAKNISLNKDFQAEIKKYGFKKIVPFFVNDDMQKLSDMLDIPLSVNQKTFIQANDKLLLKKFLTQVNLPIIEGTFTADIEILKKYFQKDERYLFKDPLGVSGYGFWDNKETTFEELEKKYGGKELIVEKFIIKESSPSVQFFINEEKTEAIIFGMTDQLLENGKIYLGNTSPSVYLNNEIGDELIRQSSQIIDYISQLGYTGFAGIDFIVDENKSVYATEVNARFTGATYPAITSLLLNDSLISNWEFYNYEGETEGITQYLKDKVILSKKQAGIFPLGLSGIEKFGKANLLKFN